MVVKNKRPIVKYRLLTVIVLGLFIIFLLNAGGKSQPNKTSVNLNKGIFEAEESMLDKTIAYSDSSASGGRYVHIADSGAVTFNIPVKESGRYRLHIAYRSPGKDNAQRILVNGIEYAPEIGFPASGKWGEIWKAAGLKRGRNRVEIRACWGHMDIDYMLVEGPVTDRPEITPVQNTFYQNKTKSDLFVQLEKNHRIFTSLTCNGREVPYKAEPVSWLEDALLIQVPLSFLETLKKGQSSLSFHFEDTEPVLFSLQVTDLPPLENLVIVSLDVSHGTAVLILFPTGKTMLIDTGTETMCRERVLPFLNRHHIDPNYLWITHYHDDHCGGKKMLLNTYPDLILKDYKSFRSGETFDFEKTRMTILNSFEDGNEREGENSRSLSFRMAYKGFIYVHGGDIYAGNQQRILKEFKEDGIKCHVYHANHHFHGSVDVDYLRASDPYLFITSGEEHIYGRGAYTTLVQEQVLPWLRQHHGRLIEDLLHFEAGHVVIRVADGNHWHYETYRDVDTVIPYIQAIH